jgi:hypothetical protein
MYSFLHLSRNLHLQDEVDVITSELGALAVTSQLECIRRYRLRTLFQETDEQVHCIACNNLRANRLHEITNWRPCKCFFLCHFVSSACIWYFCRSLASRTHPTTASNQYFYVNDASHAYINVLSPAMQISRSTPGPRDLDLVLSIAVRQFSTPPRAISPRCMGTFPPVNVLATIDRGRFMIDPPPRKSHVILGCRAAAVAGAASTRHQNHGERLDRRGSPRNVQFKTLIMVSFTENWQKLKHYQ